MATIYTYPYDPNGTATTNKVLAEQHVVNPVPYTDYHYIIPKFAPFFKSGLILKRMPSGTVLKEGVDYALTHRFLRASRIAAKSIYGSITFLDKTLTGVIAVTYQNLGGGYTQSNTQLANILANKAMNPRITSWEQVAELPQVFPTGEHDFDVDNVVYGNDIVTSINNIRDSILARNSSAMTAHMNARTGNVHGVTKTDVELGNVNNFPLATKLQAEAGLVNTAYLTPMSGAQLTNALARGKDWKPDWNTEIANRPTTFPADPHGHGVATSTISGYMSAADKLKLDTSFINIKEYGAIGDGKLHPVSEWVTAGKFANLAGIQFVYPHVQALTDSIDYAAIQAALNNAGGHQVWAPKGDYVLNRGLRRGKALGFWGAGVGYWQPGTSADYGKYTLGVGTNLVFVGPGPKDCELADVTNMRQAGHVHRNPAIDTSLQDHLIAYGNAVVKDVTDSSVPATLPGVTLPASVSQVVQLNARDTFPAGFISRTVSVGDTLAAKFTVSSKVASKRISIGFALMDGNGVIKNWLAVASVAAKTESSPGVASWSTVTGSITAPAGYVSAKPWIQVDTTPTDAPLQNWFVGYCEASLNGSHFTHDGEFKLTDFTNQNAVGVRPASSRKFSVAFYSDGRDGFEMGNMRLVPNHYDATMGDTDNVGLGGYRNRNNVGWGDEWEVGLYNASTRNLQTTNLQVVGYWRLTGLLGTPTDNTNRRTGLSKMCRFDNSTFQGVCGVSLRDGDYWPLVQKTSNSLTTRWTLSHRFPASGTIYLTGSRETYRTYTGLTYDQNTQTLTFTGISDTASIDIATTFISMTDNQGMANTVFNGCDISDLAHTSRCVEYSPAFGNLARAPGAALEISGKNIRGVQFNACSFYSVGPVMFHLGRAKNISFNGCLYEPLQWKLKPAITAPFVGKVGSVWIAGPDTTVSASARRYGGTDLRVALQSSDNASLDRSPYLPANTGYRGSGSNLFNPNEYSDDSQDLQTDSTLLPDRREFLWPNGTWSVSTAEGYRRFVVAEDVVNFPIKNVTIGSENLYRVISEEGGRVDHLAVEPYDTSTNPALRLIGQASNSCYLASYVRGIDDTIVRRWVVKFKDGGTESGVSTGGDIMFDRYNNAGDYIDTPLSISRETGTVDFITVPTVGGQALSADLFNALPLSGGKLTGPLSIVRDDSATLTLDSKSDPAYSNVIYGAKGGHRQWAVVLGSGETKTTNGQGVTTIGSGAEFYIQRYDEAGAVVEKVLSVNYKTGVTDFARLPTVAGTPITPLSLGALALSGGKMTGPISFDTTMPSGSALTSTVDGVRKWRVGLGDDRFTISYASGSSAWQNSLEIDPIDNRVNALGKLTVRGAQVITWASVVGEADKTVYPSFAATVSNYVRNGAGGTVTVYVTGTASLIGRVVPGQTLWIRNTIDSPNYAWAAVVEVGSDWIKMPICPENIYLGKTGVFFEEYTAYPSSPLVRDKIPIIRKDSVLEIGKYLDFHADTGADYDARLYVDMGAGHLVSTSVFKAPSLITGSFEASRIFSTGEMKASGTISITGAPGGWRQLLGQSNNIVRWNLSLGDSTNEGGGNLGSDFSVYRYGDGGDFLGVGLSIRRNDGQVTIPSSVYVGGNIEVNDVYTRSDSTVKHNARPISGAVEKVRKLVGLTYDKDGSTGRRAGVYAQDLRAVLPESVVESVDGTLMIDLSGPIALLVEAFKELDSRVSLLESR